MSEEERTPKQIYKEDVHRRVIGQFQDVKIDKNGKRTVINPFTKQDITESFYLLTASHMKGDIAYPNGLQYWAVGIGLPSWNPDSPPPANPWSWILTQEIDRVPLDYIKYMDEQWVEQVGRSTRLEMKATFDHSHGNGNLMEFGICGGNATLALTSGVMCDISHHPVVEKTVDWVLERTLRLTI